MVVVGDSGTAQHAETSLQLANALSLSIWDLTDPFALVLNALVTNQQVGCALLCTNSHMVFFVRQWLLE